MPPGVAWYPVGGGPAPSCRSGARRAEFCQTSTQRVVAVPTVADQNLNLGRALLALCETLSCRSRSCAARLAPPAPIGPLAAVLPAPARRLRRSRSRTPPWPVPLLGAEALVDALLRDSGPPRDRRNSGCVESVALEQLLCRHDHRTPTSLCLFAPARGVVSPLDFVHHPSHTFRYSLTVSIWSNHERQSHARVHRPQIHCGPQYPQHGAREPRRLRPGDRRRRVHPESAGPRHRRRAAPGPPPSTNSRCGCAPHSRIYRTRSTTSSATGTLLR